VKIIKFIQKYGYTNEKSSIHYNVSFGGDDKNLNDLNILKLILKTDEEEIYRYYPSRKDNVYAKTIKKIIPYKEYDFFNVQIETVKNNLRLPSDKYYGINFMHINSNKEDQRLEFRYIGGKDYEKNIGQLIYFMDKFIINIYNCIGEPFDTEDSSKLEEYLETNINLFKNFSKYDNFIVEFPTIQIQIDQNGSYDVVSAYYPRIYNRLYSLIDNTIDLKECMINYVTNVQTMEVIDAKVKSSSNLNGYDFVNCKVEGIVEESYFTGCEISNSQLTKCSIENSDADNSKILNSKSESSTLTDCYVMNGVMNCDMNGGVFRSGKLGPYATMDSDVKVVTDSDNFFDTKFEEEGVKGSDKGVVKAFGKPMPKKQ
jgi:hypothetical protein